MPAKAATSQRGVVAIHSGWLKEDIRAGAFSRDNSGGNPNNQESASRQRRDTWFFHP
jgi:hypothetical protein